MRNKNKAEGLRRRRGTTYIETVLCIFLVAIFCATVFAVSAFLRSEIVGARCASELQAYLVTLSEKMENDVRTGVDIASYDYSDDGSSSGITAAVTIQREDDIFGADLYYVSVRAGVVGERTRAVSKYILRGADIVAGAQ